MQRIMYFPEVLEFNCLVKYITSMGQEPKSTGNWRVDNIPIVKRVASANDSESQMSAGCTRLQQHKKKEPATSQRAAEAELTLGAERTKNKLPDNWGTDKSQPRAQQVMSAESLEWHAPRIQP
jgi:hypothetical protein